MRLRVVPIAVSHVLILAEDDTHARRVEQIRRDFVANVSHELKTPVGGISLLAETLLGAKDDPEAVARFAERILVESSRLTRLVEEILDLSGCRWPTPSTSPSSSTWVRSWPRRSTGCGWPPRPRTSTHPRQRGGLRVFGDAELLTTAVGEPGDNAMNYSESGTRVGVGARRVEDSVEVTVTDQGQGIPAAEQDRIFERFYRVDDARSRDTGGTGLGLAIVKHVAPTTAAG